MAARDRLSGLVAGALTGIAGGMFGVGGGLVLVPILTGFYRLTHHQAIGTSLAVIGATAISAVLIYGSHQNIAWSAAPFIALGSVLSASLGARWANRIPAARLSRGLAVLMALVAVRLLWEAPAVSATGALSGWAGVLASLGLGLGAGLLAGMMGVGGGIIVVPILTLVFGLSQQAAQGTSLAVMVVTALSAAREHARHRNVVWRLVPMLALGAALGAPFASWAVQRLPHALLARGFALVLFATAVHTWSKGSSGAPPAAQEPALAK